MFGMGITMVGPTLLDYGTEEQKQRHIPPIVRGDVRWCIGYSEPNAGSDLASLQMRCEDAGDHWRINGQKIWTSGADRSDWCGALVRTDFSVKKHDGISFMLIDMHQSGDRDPADQADLRLLAVLRDLLHRRDRPQGRHARPDQQGLGRRQAPAAARARQPDRRADGRRPGQAARRTRPRLRRCAADDVELMGRINLNAMDARAHGLTLERAASEARGNSGPGHTPSILKNSATAVAQGPLGTDPGD